VLQLRDEVLPVLLEGCSDCVLVWRWAERHCYATCQWRALRQLVARFPPRHHTRMAGATVYCSRINYYFTEYHVSWLV
jgi:hypothetical protein